MLKIGVLGVGHLGKIHLKCIKTIPNLDLVGFFDPDDENALNAAQKFQVERFQDISALIEAVDILDIVTPTTSHYDLARRAIECGKHVFIEKPLTQTIAEAEALIELSKGKKVKIQVGHVERFNPALLALNNWQLKPLFIEAHRLATFNPRGTDVSVVLDLMIHDLDIILKLVQSPVKQVNASGVSIISDTLDLSNARIEFENGCVANVTASRLSLKQMRKIRLFQKDAYISLDFLKKKTEIVKILDDKANLNPNNAQFFQLKTQNGQKYIQVEMPEIKPVNAIQMELETFANAISNDEEPKVTLNDGYEALKLAFQIIEDIEKRNGLLTL